MRRRTAVLVAGILALPLTAACSSDDAIDAAAAQQELGTEADAATGNTAPQAEAGASSAERSACKAAVAVQSRRNFDIILTARNPEDPRIDRSEPRACSGLDQATKTTIAREVADELAKERQRRP